MSHTPMPARINRIISPHFPRLLRASFLTSPNRLISTTASHLTLPSQSQPTSQPPTSESQHTSTSETLNSTFIYPPELRAPAEMSDYKPPYKSRKKRRQEAAALEASSRRAVQIETPIANVTIPEPMFGSQVRDVSAPRPPTQPAAMSQPTPKNKNKSKGSSPPPSAPSASSGGVPNPTPQYIAQALLNPQTLTQPRRILIIMDLNGTLLHRPNKRRPFNFVQRPHARAFLNYCLETFYVAIWSSARPENVSKMVDQLLTPAQRDRCLLIWARDRFGLSPSDYDSKVQVYKRLTSVWSNPRVMASHPSASEGGRWDQTNTVLVDDSFEKARSEPFNVLQLPEFSGLATEQPHVLPQVHDYLNALSHQCDISRFIRTSPFRLDPGYKLLSS